MEGLVRYNAHHVNSRLLQGDLTALKRTKADSGPRKTTILNDVSCMCSSGEVLAM